MTDNYDKDSIIHEDQRALKLTHYQMAERCMLVEYATIREEMDDDGSSTTLIHILAVSYTHLTLPTTPYV